MKRTDFEIVQRMQIKEDSLTSIKLFEKKQNEVGLYLAILSVYHLGKLHGIRQERQRRRLKD